MGTMLFALCIGFSLGTIACFAHRPWMNIGLRMAIGVFGALIIFYAGDHITTPLWEWFNDAAATGYKVDKGAISHLALEPCAVGWFLGCVLALRPDASPAATG